MKYIAVLFRNTKTGSPTNPCHVTTTAHVVTSPVLAASVLETEDRPIIYAVGELHSLLVFLNLQSIDEMPCVSSRELTERRRSHSHAEDDSDRLGTIPPETLAL